MQILLVHQNFPGQFVHLAPALVRRGHRVLGLGDVENRRARPPVETFYYRSPVKDRLKGIGATYADAVARGEMVAGACSQLRDRNGFRPDVILGHNGWGETLFLRDVWPEARILNYAEFAYRARGLDADFDPEFQRMDAKARMAVTARAAHILQATLDADAAVAPTRWQADSFPGDLRAKISVIHDGVDSDALCPNPDARFGVQGSDLILRAGDEVLTFVNRNLEPYRGYHIVMRALPAILAARPRAQVVIVGGDRPGYGAAPATGTWKDRFLDEVRDRLDLSRVHFVGRLDRAAFISLMQVARVHAYLTYPFVLSWSLIEAMSMGALVVASDTGPVKEVLQGGVNGRLVDFFDVAGWSDAIIRALADPGADAGLRAAARATVQDRFDLKRQCLPRMVGFVEAAGGGVRAR